MKNNTFSLNAYSLLSVSFLMLHNESIAQAIYTDLEPDIVLQLNNEIASIDMDNNGIYDFAFLKTSGTYTTGYSSSSRFRHAVWAGPFSTIQDEIAGISVTHGAGYGTSYFPFAIEASGLINEDLTFQYDGFQLLALKRVPIGSTNWDQFPAYWGYDSIDHYLGVRFIGNDACFHYGWIRCAVIEGGEKLIIKDYAYELKCATGIKAGDMIGDTAVSVYEINTLDANVYSFGNTIYIQLHENIQNKILIHIYDLSGKEIYVTSTQDSFSEIKLDEPAGIYLVEIISNEKTFSKKVFLD